MQFYVTQNILLCIITQTEILFYIRKSHELREKTDSYLVFFSNCLGHLPRSWSFTLLNSIFFSSPALIQLLSQQLIQLPELPFLSTEVTALFTISGTLWTFASHWQWVGPWPLDAKGWSRSRDQCTGFCNIDT